MEHVAWLLEADGSVTKVYSARKTLWPGSAHVTLQNGTTKIVNALNVLSKDDLGRRFF